MTPIGGDEWQRCGASLAIADQVAAIPIPSVAAKEAYLACLHAANAYVLERRGDVPRTHRGVQKVFRDLCLELGEVDVAHAAFLAQAYQMKDDADYFDRTLVTAENLPDVMARAHALVAAIAAALDAPAA